MRRSGLGGSAAKQRKLIPLPAILSALGLLACLITAPAALASEISVQSATYGASCGIQADNAGTSVRSFCNGRERCNYVVSSHVLGDPKPGCKKDFIARYTCGGGAQVNIATAPPEAGLGRVASLDCGSMRTPAPAPADAAASAIPKPSPVPLRPAALAPKVQPTEIAASHARFEVNGVCLGACKNLLPLENLEEQLPRGFNVVTVLPDGDSYRMVGKLASPNQVDLAPYGAAHGAFVSRDTPLAVIYQGNTAAGPGAPSRGDTIVARFRRAWRLEGAGATVLGLADGTARFSPGMPAASMAQMVITGAGGGDPLSIPGWTPASAKPHSQSGPLVTAGGILDVETRVTAMFPPGTPPGAWIAFDSASDPISPDALHAGPGPLVPPALECMLGMAGDEALGRGNRAAVAGQAAAALRCYLMGTDQGDSLAAASAGAALEEGVGAWVDLEAAIRAYKIAAAEGDTAAIEALARLSHDGNVGGAHASEIVSWRSRAVSVREMQAKACNAQATLDAAYRMNLVVQGAPVSVLASAAIEALGGLTLRTSVQQPEFGMVGLPYAYRNGFQVALWERMPDFMCVVFSPNAGGSVTPIVTEADIQAMENSIAWGGLSQEEQGILKDRISAAQTAQIAGNFFNVILQMVRYYRTFVRVTPLVDNKLGLTLWEDMLPRIKMVVPAP